MPAYYAVGELETINALFRCPASVLPIGHRWLHWYDDAEVAAPPTYFGYVGYEHSGRLFSPAVTVIDIPGATPRSTQLKSSVRRSQPLGTGATASVLPSP